VIKILMTVYGLTAEQAAARAPAAQFVLTAVVAAVRRRRPLDGSQAQGGAGCCIRGLMRRLATLTLLCAPSAIRGVIPFTAPMMA